MDPYFHAGTRLKPRGYQVGDLKVLEGTREQDWVDIETGIACGFRVGADGVERCLPSADGIEGGYADAKCTIPVWVGRAPGGLEPLPRYVALGGPLKCSERVYQVGTSPSANGRTFVLNEAGVCEKNADRPMDGFAIYPLTEVPLATFVAVNRVSRPRAPHMDAVVREGDDGSFEVVGMFDPVRKEPCSPVGRDVSPQVCVPRWVQVNDTFDGANCSRRVARDIPGPTCPTRKSDLFLKVDWDDMACRTRKITGLWETTTGRAQVFAVKNGTCASTTADPVDVLLEGAPVDVNALPKLETMEVGTGPLRVRFFGYEGVPFLPVSRGIDANSATGPFLDAATGEACEPHPFADGVWRCVPQSFGQAMDFNVRFASSDCTGTRVFEGPGSSGSCAAIAREPRGLIVRSGSQAVDQHQRVVATFGVTGKGNPMFVYSGSGSSCTAERFTNGETFYEADKVLAPAEVFVPFDGRLTD